MSSDTPHFDHSVWYVERALPTLGRLWYFVDASSAYSEREALGIAELITGMRFDRGRRIQAATVAGGLNGAPPDKLGTLISPADLSRMGYTLPRKGTYE